MSDVPRDILNESFANSKKLLESIVEKEVIAFRAGGYSLETLKDFQRLFSVNNIK